MTHQNSISLLSMLSILDTDKAQCMEILLHGRQRLVCSTYVIPWLSMVWRRMGPGYQQQSYWPILAEIFRFQCPKHWLNIDNAPLKCGFSKKMLLHLSVGLSLSSWIWFEAHVNYFKFLKLFYQKYYSLSWKLSEKLSHSGYFITEDVSETRYGGPSTTPIEWEW